MSFFPCKHPAASLGVQKRETVEPSKKFPNEYEEVTYHLYCGKCGEHVDHVGYARLNAVEQAKDDAQWAAFKKRQEESERATREFNEQMAAFDRKRAAAKAGSAS